MNFRQANKRHQTENGIFLQFLAPNFQQAIYSKAIYFPKKCHDVIQVRMILLTTGMRAYPSRRRIHRGVHIRSRALHIGHIDWWALHTLTFASLRA